MFLLAEHDSITNTNTRMLTMTDINSMLDSMTHSKRIPGNMEVVLDKNTMDAMSQLVNILLGRNESPEQEDSDDLLSDDPFLAGVEAFSVPEAREFMNEYFGENPSRQSLEEFMDGVEEAIMSHFGY